MSRTPIERIDDILAAIDAIAAASGVLARNASDSGVDEVVLAAVQWHVFVIGEAVKALPDDLTAAHDDVPWRNITRMRDLIGHHYYKLDTDIVWSTVGEPLKQLRATAERIRRDLEA